MTGKKVGRLTIIERAGKNSCGSAMWRCQCDCGEERIIAGTAMRAGCALSCGCLGIDRLKAMATTHGESRTPLFAAWCEMIARCENENRKSFKNYGGRGIKVCERWRNSFVAFRDDMGPKPTQKHTLDRKENDGDYEPSNCRWATRTEQNRNTRATKLSKALALEVKIVRTSGGNVSAWARSKNVSTRVACDAAIGKTWR